MDLWNIDNNFPRMIHCLRDTNNVLDSERNSLLSRTYTRTCIIEQVKFISLNIDVTDKKRKYYNFFY